MVTFILVALIFALCFCLIRYTEWTIIILKLLYRCVKFRNQGKLYINKELIFVSETVGQDDHRTIVISTSNHSSLLCGVRIDPDHLRRYKILCGYDPDNTAVPLCYGETLFFKLLLTIITSSKFCLAPLGLIHLRQTIVQYAPLERYLDTDLFLSAIVTEYRETTRGIEVDINLSISPQDEDQIWQGTVTLFSRGKPVKRTRQPLKDNLDLSTRLSVPSNCGVQYAMLTGDVNPHHLFPWSARLLGYPRPIAHGMWTLAKTIAEYELNYTNVFDHHTIRLSCSFKRPLFMPGEATVEFDPPYTLKDKPCWFQVVDLGTRAPHLVGEISVD